LMPRIWVSPGVECVVCQGIWHRVVFSDEYSDLSEFIQRIVVGDELIFRYVIQNGSPTV
jgi:hypothetical protein